MFVFPDLYLRCSKEKIKGYKRNLTSILSTKQGKGSVLIHLPGLYTKRMDSPEGTTPYSEGPVQPGRACRVRSAPPAPGLPAHRGARPCPGLSHNPALPRHSDTVPLQLHITVHHVLPSSDHQSVWRKPVFRGCSNSARSRGVMNFPPTLG